MKYKAAANVFLTGLLLALGSVAWASTTWYVNGVSGSDSNNCTSASTPCKTIGHAISLAASGDSIKVATGTYAENLTIAINLGLIGSGAKFTIIDGGGAGTVVTISSAAAHVTLSGLTIRNGHVVGLAGAGGIRNNGTLRIVASTVSGNSASSACTLYCFARGGGIYNIGTLTISGSTLSSNLAFSWCRGHCQAFGGGIYNTGKLTITNSTLSANTAHAMISNIVTHHVYHTGIGGAIDNAGTLIMNNTTLSQNRAYSIGGGVENGGSATLQNTIIANNFGGNCYFSPTSNGYNLSSDSTCNFSGPGDMNNTDPMLGPLQYNGGPTQTIALPTGSPAVDAGNPSGCTDNLGHLLKTDQRGAPRPNPEDTAGCDMGAYERQSD